MPAFLHRQGFEGDRSQATHSSFVIVLSLAVIVIIVGLFLTSTPSFLTGL
jgi:hypothetical protein